MWRGHNRHSSPGRIVAQGVWRLRTDFGATKRGAKCPFPGHVHSGTVFRAPLGHLLVADPPVVGTAAVARAPVQCPSDDAVLGQ